MQGRVKLLASVIGLCVPVMFSANMALGDETFTATKAISLPSTASATTCTKSTSPQKVTSFDIGFVDPRTGNYFLADRTNCAIDIVDTSTNTLAAQYTDPQHPFVGASPAGNDSSGPNGVLVTDHNRIWVGDGNSTVKVLDLGTGNELTPPISTGGKKRADELCFDARNRIIVMANDAETPWPWITFIDADNYTVIGKPMVMDGTKGTVKATNGIEQCQWSPRTGKVYINIPEVNGPGDDSVPGAVLVIDAREQEVEKVFTIPLASCSGPQGMALGPDGQILLGCNDPKHLNGNTAVIDERSGAVVATLSNESGSDEVYYNPADNHYFLAESAHAPNQALGVVDAGPPAREDASATTAPATGGGAIGSNHSVASDPVTGHVYVPISSTSGSTVCSSAGGTDATGCIAVFTSPNDDCFAQGMPTRGFDNDGNPQFEHESCRDHDHHEARND